ncbi:MAG: D-3-phosphoglycerate dehydrogenase / 2-oxoglutarate reductase [Actinomycetota bacterium]
MDRPKALVTAPFRGEGLRQLEEVADVVLDPWIDHRPMRIYGPEQLVERLQETGADILICEADFCSGPVFDLPLRVIGSTRGDPTNVDVPGATAKGIPVLKAPGRNADGVAEMTVALLFAVSRHVLPADADVRALEVFRDGTVPYQRFRAWEVNGRTAGLVGLGAIGRALRWRLQGLGMEVLAYDPYSDEAKESLEEVLERSDVISMHAAVTPETLGLINAERIARMKDGVIYLNAARAALHDLDALVEGLQSGKLGGAGLDHFEGEQLPEGHPLLTMQHVVLTPHIGGATYNTEENHSRIIAADVARLLAGERPVHIANPEVLDS